MPLLENLPEAYRKTLGLPPRDNDSLVIALAADLTSEGVFGEEWLIVTRDRLIVLGAGGAGPVRRWDLALSELKDVRTETLIGGGALLTSLDHQTIELVRYTNARQRRFARAGRYLQDLADYHQRQARGGKTDGPPLLQEEPEEGKRCPSCGLFLPEGTKVCPACVNKVQVIRRLLTYLKPYWKQNALVWLLMILGSALALVPPYLTRPLIDRVLVPKDPAFPENQRLSLLGWLVLGLFVAQVLGRGIGIIQGRLLVWLGSRLSQDLRYELYQCLQLLSLRFFDQRQTGALVARLTQDTQSLERVILDGAQFFVVQVLTLVGIGGVLFWMNWKLTMLVLLPLPMVFWLSQRIWKRISSIWHRYLFTRQRFHAFVTDRLSGIRVVKAFAQEEMGLARFRDRSEELFTIELVSGRMSATIFPMLTFLTGLGGLIVWYVGGREVIGGEVTLGTLMAFMAYLGMVYGPLNYFSRLTDWLARSLAAAERVFEIIDSVPEMQDAPDAVALSDLRGRVEFRQVTFGYDRHRPVLHGVSFTVDPGEMMGLVGHSGAGKTTTINLLCRFYDVDEGQILIDGIDIRKIRLRDLRSKLGVVPQDTFLFKGAIAENIAFGKPGASPEEIIAAAKAANAHDFIAAKPDGYETQIGERGQTLSAGERQRIAIARAILHDPRILILDEATSSVDTDTEKQIKEALARLVSGRTTVSIAHRLSTLRDADRLIVLKDGKVEETGTHKELVNQKGEFYRLVQMQEEMSKIVQTQKERS